MNKVYIVGKGMLGVDAPKLRVGTRNRPMQGGHAPVPFRQHSGNLSKANSFARVPQQGVWLD